MSAVGVRIAAAPPPLRVGIVAGEHSGDQLGAAEGAAEDSMVVPVTELAGPVAPATASSPNGM